MDEEALLAELPVSMKEELLYRQYGGLVETVRMLRDCDDNEFVWAVVQVAMQMKYEKDDTIFWPGDFSDVFFMIYRGQVSLFAQNGHVFLTYGEGDLLGDSDALTNEVRDSKAVALTSCTMYTLKAEDLHRLSAEFPFMLRKLAKTAVQKRQKHKRRIAAIERKFPVFGIQGLDIGSEAVSRAKKESVHKIPNLQ